MHNSTVDMKWIFEGILFTLTITVTAYFSQYQTKTKPPNQLGKSNHNDFESGDIIFQTSTSNQSKAIQLATNSKYSHMGIIYVIDGYPYVYEAVQPVKQTKINEWISRGENGHYVVKRFDSILTKNNLQQIIQEGQKFNGKNYDLYFGWSDDKIYCSELVWKIYKRALNIEIGELQELQDFNLNDVVVKKIMKQRYGNRIPYHEKVISPAAMFEAKLLRTVFEN